MSDPSAYEGVFLRLYVPQIPNWSPVGGLWEECPDIIANGGAILDPTTLVSQYNTPSTPNLSFGLQEANFVYVRAVNSATTAITGRVWLFWVPMSTALWPTTWSGAGISVAGQMVNYQSLSLAAAPPWTDHTKPPLTSPVVATTLPFVVTPPVSLSGGETYSLVSIVENTPSTPATPPLPAPFANVSALAVWAESSGYVGWLAVNAVKPPSQPLVTTQLVSSSGTLNIGASGTNLPSDATLSIQCQGPTFATSVSISQAVGSNPNPNVTNQVTWPAVFNTSLTVSVIPGPTPLPSTASIRPLIYPAGS